MLAQHADGRVLENDYDFAGERLLKRVRLPDGEQHLNRYVFDGYQERDGEPTWIMKVGESKVAEIRETAGLDPDLWTLYGLVGYAIDPGRISSARAGGALGRGQRWRGRS